MEAIATTLREIPIALQLREGEQPLDLLTRLVACARESATTAADMGPGAPSGLLWSVAYLLETAEAVAQALSGAQAA